MRLIDIIVDEVSLVDKAANKKCFAFVKRDQTQDVKKADADPAAPAPAPAQAVASAPAAAPAAPAVSASVPAPAPAVQTPSAPATTVPAPAPEGAVPAVAKPAAPEWTAEHEQHFNELLIAASEVAAKLKG